MLLLMQMITILSKIVKRPHRHEAHPPRYSGRMRGQITLRQGGAQCSTVLLPPMAGAVLTLHTIVTARMPITTPSDTRTGIL